ncbi:MAG: exosortase/archaeosortase family protein, partial [bacterium]
MEKNKVYTLWIKSSFVFLSIMLFYHQDLMILFNEALNSDLATHILAIPFFLAFILYRTRNILRAFDSDILRSRNSLMLNLLKDLMGILLCALAYLIKWIGSYSFHTLEYHIASLPLFTSGIILLLFDFNALRGLLFPIVFSLFLIPPPVEIVQQVGTYLSFYSSIAAYNILKIMQLPVSLSYTDGNPIIYVYMQSGENIPFVIDLACSGIYSLMGFLIFGLFIAYLIRGKMIKKFMILVIGFPIIYILNIIRIIILVIIGFFSGPHSALNIFHMFGGWVLIFLGTFIILVVSEKLLKIRLFDRENSSCNNCGNNSNIPYCSLCGRVFRFNYNLSTSSILKMICILIILISLTFTQIPVYTLTKGSANILMKDFSGETSTLKIFPIIENYDLHFVYRDVSFEEISGQYASLVYQYVPEDPSKPIIWITLEIGSAKANLHPWEVCLVTWPQILGKEPLVVQLDLKDVKLLENPPLTARYFAYLNKQSGLTETILYWYTRSVFMSEKEYTEKWLKISVLSFKYYPEDYIIAEEEIYPFAKKIAEYSQPIITWSKFALAIAYNGPILLLIVIGGIISLIVFYELELFSRKRNANIIYN